MPQLDLTTYTVQFSEIVVCWLFFYLVFWSCRGFKLYFLFTLRRFLLTGACRFFFVRDQFSPSRYRLVPFTTRQRAIDTLIMPSLWKPCYLVSMP